MKPIPVPGTRVSPTSLSEGLAPNLNRELSDRAGLFVESLVASSRLRPDTAERFEYFSPTGVYR